MVNPISFLPRTRTLCTPRSSSSQFSKSMILPRLSIPVLSRLRYLLFALFQTLNFNSRTFILL
nr:MAG TPA: hypothetical protein [Caudoviricetes sp.]